MRILILSTAFSGMAQRLLTELQPLNHQIEQHYDLEPDSLREQVARFEPQVILCPFLTQKIPEDIYQKYLCLIVHPGIEGDRGASSLDWAITEGAEQWGVTLLQADDEMDAGDIWGTQNFPLRKAGKTSIYKREVTDSAMTLIKNALMDIERGDFKPRRLDYSNPTVKGRLRDTMKQKDRTIDWATMSADEIVQRVNGADSRPGVLTDIEGHRIYVFGAVAERHLSGQPGELVGIHNGAVCFACKDSAVWCRQLKAKKIEGLAPVKLPAAKVLSHIYPAEDLAELQAFTPNIAAHNIDDIKVEYIGQTAYIYFDFYNGAMNTEQCHRLREHLINVKASDAKVIVLMGGEDFWSNGIHLNCIEASGAPADESWDNINAIDDVVMEIMDTPNQVTIAALRNNAGAGGAIMALACDEVVIRQGVVLNPHYKSMGLYGSEYWTYLLPKHVGYEAAMRIMDECQPMGALEALNNGMADVLLAEEWSLYHEQLQQYCERLYEVMDFDDFLSLKVKQFQAQEAEKPLAQYRKEELAHMNATFYNLASDYHEKRRDFVYKVTKPKQAVNV